MKIKKLLVISAIAILSIQINAQETQRKPGDNFIITDTIVIPPTLPDYYTGKNIISGTSFSFKNVDDSDNYLTLSNINNVKFEMNPLVNAPVIEDGFPIGIIYLFSLAKYNDINQVLSSFRDALGSSVINQFKLANNSSIIEVLFIVELNGTVSEVKFLLRKDPLILSIPPEKLYALELLIKQRVSFTIRQGNWMPPFISGHHLPIKIKDL